MKDLYILKRASEVSSVDDLFKKYIILEHLFILFSKCSLKLSPLSGKVPNVSAMKHSQLCSY